MSLFWYLGRVAEWVKTLLSSWKVHVSKTTGTLARLRDPNAVIKIG